MLLVSGHIEEGSDRAEVLGGGRSFLAKPFTPAALVDRVRALLGQRGRAPGSSPSPGDRATEAARDGDP